MTVEAYTPPALYTVSGTGPYAFNHAFRADEDIVVSIVDGTVITPLNGADFSVTPNGGSAGGIVTLTAGAAATHAGKKLRIDRDTAREQGFVGATSREKGMERQLDAMVMAIQENAERGARALVIQRGNGPTPEIPAIDDGHTLIADAAGGFLQGPNIEQIADAADNAAVASASAISAMASSAAAGIASGRLEITEFSQLAADFVYSDPSPSQKIAAAGDVIVNRKNGTAHLVLLAGEASADLDYTASGGVKLDALPNADGTGNVDALGAAGDGGGNDAAAVTLACARFAKVVFNANKTYRFTGPVNITTDTVIDFQGAKVIFGSGHLNLFHVTAPIDRLEIRNCGRVTLEGVTAGEAAFKNFVSNYAEEGTVIGFPTGAVTAVRDFSVDNCDVDAARVLVRASRTFKAQDNRFISADYIVRPACISGLGDEATEISGNIFDADFHEDVVKGGRGRARITQNHFIHRGAGNAQLDIYATIDQANITDNYLFNVQIHRKQTGLSAPGSAIDEGFNVISQNNIEWTRAGYPVYFRGSEAVISGNTFKVTKPDAGEFACIYLDDEEAIYDYRNTTEVARVVVTGNMADLSRGNGENAWFCRRDPSDGSGGPNIIVGNLMRGGDRFTRGSVAVLAGNTWVGNPDGSGGADLHEVQAGNFMPASSPIYGAETSSAGFLAVDSGASNQEISVRNHRYVRKIGGGSISNLTNASPGQVVTIYNRAGACTVLSDPAAINLNGSANFVMGTRSTLTLLRTPDNDGVWQEVSRTT